MVQRRARLGSSSTTRASSKSLDFFSSSAVEGSRARKAMRELSGAHSKELTEFLAEVSLTGSPPERDMRKIWSLSSRSERKASHLPSGDQRGLVSDLAELVHWRISEA